jgi:DNA-binding MarR family transcriptional regulator
MSNLTEAISYISDLVEKVLEETISQADFTDLTQQQLRYLQVIFRMKNPTLTELARELDLTKPTVTVLADKLVEKGYIKRVKSDQDRRSMHLHIDKKGTKIEALREIAYERMVEKISSGLSETETSILTELLRKIVVNN